MSCAWALVSTNAQVKEQTAIIITLLPKRSDLKTPLIKRRSQVWSWPSLSTLRRWRWWVVRKSRLSSSNSYSRTIFKTTSLLISNSKWLRPSQASVVAFCDSLPASSLKRQAISLSRICRHCLLSALFKNFINRIESAEVGSTKPFRRRG